jgi:hypothetical protein
VLVEQSAPYGLLITNGQFVAFKGPDPTMVEVAEANGGSVRFANCAFWGACRQIARVAGHGTVGFSDCTFTQWDSKEEGRHAIQASGGMLLVRGCEFRQDKPQVELGEGVERAVITGNVFRGQARITNHARGEVRVAENAAERKPEVPAATSEPVETRHRIRRRPLRDLFRPGRRW